MAADAILSANALAKALAELQTKLPRISKANEAEVKSERTGRTFKYRYADLAEVSRALLPIMGALGLSFSCCPTLGPNGEFALAYTLRHAAGEQIDGIYPLPQGGSPQAIGTAITYARRYCLCAVTGAAADEDDDDAATAQREDGLPVNRDGSLSRSRTTDDQKDAAGVMTSQQLADHTALRPGRGRPAERVTGQPGPDEWTVDGREDQPGTIQASQRTTIMAQMAALGINKREDRLAKLSGVLGGPVESTNDLSYEQAARVLEQLHAQSSAGVSG